MRRASLIKDNVTLNLGFLDAVIFTDFKSGACACVYVCTCMRVCVLLLLWVLFLKKKHFLGMEREKESPGLGVWGPNLGQAWFPLLGRVWAGRPVRLRSLLWERHSWSPKCFKARKVFRVIGKGPCAGAAPKQPRFGVSGYLCASGLSSAAPQCLGSDAGSRASKCPPPPGLPVAADLVSTNLS